MGVTNATLLSGATISVSGGTSKSFQADGYAVPNGIHIVDVSEADYRIRKSITLRNRNPVLVNGKYSKHKRWMTTVFPQIEADGSISFNVIRSEVEFTTTMPSADTTDMLKMHSQLFVDADFTSFLTVGSLV